MLFADNRYYYDTMIRFALGRQHPELLAKLDKQIKEENQRAVKSLGKEHRIKIRFPENPSEL
jgi:hypothetical protein